MFYIRLTPLLLEQIIQFHVCVYMYTDKDVHTHTYEYLRTCLFLSKGLNYL